MITHVERITVSSSLCDDRDAYILVSGTITIAVLAAGGGNTNIQVVLKSCIPFTNSISEVNNTQIDNCKEIDVVMPMYNLIEYSDNYSKTTVSLWQYYRDETVLTDAYTLDNFLGTSALFKFKQKITGSIGNDGAINNYSQYYSELFTILFTIIHNIIHKQHD